MALSMTLSVASATSAASTAVAAAAVASTTVAASMTMILLVVDVHGLGVRLFFHKVRHMDLYVHTEIKQIV
jgi:hypothetical protein